ncbi:ABC transporter permease [Propionibacterium australiense]|uniref:FtsX-like permease family n=1 Tax=Propionibacterium australiense TaxID=119981 RepID=A0A383S5R6_9ACTN|nr:FtsX-like permease family protein [Propionibacterium australiense]RLP11922.1 FtsX-like permease family protein [Propionibacterium australiense]RLP12560.1 FtsX-like permease family protein [Propionibacterium australiense]SYZ32616.1 FtsX-like permease family [Propionibacterium australiense]VEH91633.1 Macrolide export ATP-binding/permease protein MacB [Propionibacterium australiense]
MNPKRRLFIRMVMSSILRRHSRVVVAMLAVAVGATTLSALATISVDVPRQMAREMRSAGANMLLTPAGDANSFDVSVVEEITGEIGSDELVGAVGIDYEAVLVNDLPYVAAGADLDAARRLNPYWYVDGAWPSGAGQVLIGRDIAEAVDAQAGDTITLSMLAEDDSGDGEGDASTPAAAATNENGKEISNQDVSRAGATTSAETTVTVSGVLETGGNEDGFVYLAMDELTELTGEPPVFTVAEFSISGEGDALQTLADRISARHPEVSAAPVARLAQSDSDVLGMLRSLMVIISVIVLALIMIGVSTTMMAVVTERRNEIGLRKALGADDGSIIGEFLGEGVVLGLIGGLIGAAAGFGLAQVISLNVFHRTVEAHLLILVGTVVAAVLVSTLASLIPVRRAVDVDPALVLRGE